MEAFPTLFTYNAITLTPSSLIEREFISQIPGFHSSIVLVTLQPSTVFIMCLPENKNVSKMT